MPDWRSASATDIGDRESNQDCLGEAHLPGRACFVVCDGLGGHAGGARASRVAVDAMLAAWRELGAAPLREQLERSVHAAHRAVQAAQREAAELADMRTTLVALASSGDAVGWAHVGDSRLYHFAAGHLVTQTRDHSVPQMLVTSGELAPDQVRHHPDRNRLLGTLGNSGEVRPSLRVLDRAVMADDAFLLCTDGFWEAVVETRMAACLATGTDVGTRLAALRAAWADGRGEDADNVTLLLAMPG